MGRVGAWRDPYVFLDPKSKNYYMLISARENNGRREYNGCAAIAQSNDLINWKILPPLFSPGVYDEVETIKMIYHDDRYYLFFSTAKENYKPEFAKKNGADGGLHCYYSDNLFGDYQPVNDTGVVFGKGDKVYDVELIHDKDNDFFAIGFLYKGKDRKLVGKLTKPFRVRIEKDKIFVN